MKNKEIKQDVKIMNKISKIMEEEKIKRKEKVNVKELTRKYFWQQKRKEFFWVFVVIVSFLCLFVFAYALGNIGTCYKLSDSAENSANIYSDELCTDFEDYLAHGLVTLAGIFCILVLIGIILYSFYYFYNSNMKKAKERAVIEKYGEKYVDALAHEIWKNTVSIMSYEARIKAIEKLYQEDWQNENKITQSGN